MSAPRPRRGSPNTLAAALALGPALWCPTAAAGQTVPVIPAFEATPIGALPPIALPMPASRNHNYWGFRLQVGQRGNRDGPDLTSIGGGVDLQVRSGTVFGLTAGWQTGDCGPAAASCGGHALFGIRSRVAVLTSGPSVGELFGDYSANVSLGADLGFGYAPDGLGDADACTVDLGVPISLAMLQRVRLVTFITPAIVWDVRCPNGRTPGRSWALANLGVALQQIGLRGLDVHLGFQKVFDSGTGYHLGISVTYIHVR